MNAGAYLTRIGYAGSTRPGADVLRALHRAHLLAVPFENLSIHSGEPIVLDDAALFDKIVERRRGGFCYELNGLFAGLLRELGFDVRLLSAGVMSPNGEFGPPFDHMALEVRLEQRWLVDVGFGDSFIEPLRLDSTVAQLQPNGTFTLSLERTGTKVLFRTAPGQPSKAQYRIFGRARSLADFEPMCRFHQKSPQSPFTKKRLCSRLTSTGRITLSERQLIEIDLTGTKQERMLESDAEVEQVFERMFSVPQVPGFSGSAELRAS